jgi:predicted ATPase
MITSVLLSLRLHQDWTQEELAVRSGVSVRTIRNLESGRIQNPRASTVDLLLAALDPDLQVQLRDRANECESMVTAFRTELLQAGPPAVDLWRGPRPPRTSLIGRDLDLGRLAELVTMHPVTVLTGPGGVGKSRLALAVAETVGSAFAAGVIIAQLGRLPREGRDCEQTFDLALRTVTKQLDGRRSSGQPMLLVLDNTEHLPQTTTLLVEHLLSTLSGLHLIVTTRCPPVLAAARIWEVAALPIEPAVELLSQRLPTDSLALELADAPGQLAGLCRELDGIPRLIEFAAHRLRIAPLSALMSNYGSQELLWAPDFLALPHQRSLEASLRWSWDLLTGRQRGFLTRLAELPEHLPGTGDALAGLVPDLSGGEAVSLLADLADTSMLQVHRGEQYEYRMMRHVRTFISALARLPSTRSVSASESASEAAAVAHPSAVDSGEDSPLGRPAEKTARSQVIHDPARHYPGYRPAGPGLSPGIGIGAGPGPCPGTGPCPDNPQSAPPALARETAVMTRPLRTSHRPVS